MIGSEGVSATGASVSAQKAREWITFGDLNRKYGRG